MKIKQIVDELEEVVKDKLSEEDTILNSIKKNWKYAESHALESNSSWGRDGENEGRLWRRRKNNDLKELFKDASDFNPFKCKAKNPAYGRHRISWPMRIVGPIQFWRGCVIYL